MGRKKSPQKKVKDATAKKDSLLRNDILQVLFSLFDLGVIRADREEISTRQQFVVSIRKLSKFIEAFELSRGAGNEMPEEASSTQMPENCSGLIELEESALEVRFICKTYADMIQYERKEVLQIHETYEDIFKAHASAFCADPSSYAQEMLLIRKLLSQYSVHLYGEETMLNEILEFLTNIYDVGGAGIEASERKIQRISQWSRLVSERTFLENDYWSFLPEVINKLHDTGKLHSAEEISPRYFSEMSPATKSALSGREALLPAYKSHWLVRTQTVGEAVDLFIGDKYSDSMGDTTFLLLIGDQGCGKTYACDEIERKVSNVNSSQEKSIRLIRPSMPLDLMGRSVGESEDILVSLFGCCQASSTRCVVILDDIEHILGNSASDQPQNQIVAGVSSHVAVRATATLFGIMDSTRQKAGPQEGISSGEHGTLVICASRRVGNDIMNRFDKVFALDAPDESERKAMITSSLGLASSCHSHVQYLVSEIADKTIGRSFAEIAQYCRRATSLSAFESATRTEEKGAGDISVLRHMISSLGSSAPESLRSGSLDCVDMSVFSAQDLLMGEKFPVKLPLFGYAAEEASRQIERLIVTPLCRSKAFDEIMFGSRKSTRGGMSAGVLLTGPSGSGKTSLARHCAKIAASVLDSLTLLDVSCTSLVHKEVGGSERALKRLFSAARAAAPCILLMDGIENIAAVRGNDNTTEGTMDRMLSTLLTELDGIDEDLARGTASSSIAVIGITQYTSWIDPALLRPGRLEKTIRMEHPNSEARRRLVLEQVLRLPLDLEPQPCGRTATPHVVADFVANSRLTSAGELIAVCQEASLVSIRRQIDIRGPEAEAKICFKDFESALDARCGGA